MVGLTEFVREWWPALVGIGMLLAAAAVLAAVMRGRIDPDEDWPVQVLALDEGALPPGWALYRTADGRYQAEDHWFAGDGPYATWPEGSIEAACEAAWSIHRNAEEKQR